MRGLLALPLILASCLTAPSDRTFVASENLDEVELLKARRYEGRRGLGSGAIEAGEDGFAKESYLVAISSQKRARKLCWSGYWV